MYQDTIDQFAETAAKKVRAITDNPLGFFVAAMLAGAYVGLGIIAIFSIGQGLDPSVRPLAMGLTFAIALTLVVFAGAELFTGHTMIMTLGVLRGKASLNGLASSWVMTWVGNLAGAVLVATIFWLGGGGATFFGAGSRPSRWARLRASLRARRTASAFWRARFSDGFS